MKRRGTMAWGRGGGTALALGVVALVGLLLASCAPYAVPRAQLDEGARQARFLRALEERRRGARTVDLDASLWVRTSGVEDVPGMQARLLLAAPDAFRIRVGSSFGTALDLAARGDSLAAYVPGARIGIEIDAVRDSLGLRDPGGLGFKLWSAGWDPPREAWSTVAWSDTLRFLAWWDGADSVALEVGSDGLPRTVRLSAAAEPVLVAEYRGWQVWDGVLWPARLAIGDAAGRVRLTCVVHRARFREPGDPGRVRLRLPAGAERFTPAQLLRILERVTSSS